MTPLEKAARALCAADSCVADDPYESACGDVGPVWELYLPEARTVLLAIREPTPEMVDAARLCTVRNSRPVNPSVPFESPWTAQIDHILADAGEGGR